MIYEITALIMEAEIMKTERDAYRRIARDILALIHEGQARGLQDATVNRMTSRYDVAAMGKLEAEMVRLERGMV